jgi:hypothetical protein
VNALQALLLFVGIPVAFAGFVYVAVSASSWTRSGRASADYEGGPFLVASDPAVPNPSILPYDIGSTSVVGGGISAQW